MKSLGFALVLVVGIVMSATAFAGGATTVGGGGDHYSAQFIELGRGISRALFSHSLSGVNPELFKRAVETTKVNSQQKLALNGNIVDAINYPNTKQIIQSRESWDKMAGNWSQRVRLVLHEYLGIMNLDDSSYQISNQFDPSWVISFPAKFKFNILNTAGYCDYINGTPSCSRSGYDSKIFEIELKPNRDGSGPRSGFLRLIEPFREKNKNSDVGNFWAEIRLIEEIPGQQYELMVDFYGWPNFQKPNNYFSSTFNMIFSYPAGFFKLDLVGPPARVSNSPENPIYQQGLKVEWVP